jgi:carboxyl-terminal processing protease
MPRIPRLTVIAAGLALAGAPRLAAQSESYQDLQTFSYLLSEVRLNYVRPVATPQLIRAAIEGMLSSLDPHSRFVPREENDRWLAWQGGQLAGTGIVLGDEDGTVTVAAVQDRSPAARVGIVPGDRLLALNDTLVAGTAIGELQDRLLGEKGRKVRIRLARGPRLEPDTLTITVRCDVLRPRSVTVVRRLAPGIGYVRLAEFQERAGTEVHDAVARVLGGQRVRRLVLDLRGDPGGSVQAAVAVASEFLPNGAVVFRVEGRRAQLDHVFSTTHTGEFVDVPMVVLINRYTASAAEALAGALQDHDRAEILGRRSFGKALEQQLFPVPPKGDAVWLTVGYLHSPSGRLIQRRYAGLSPEQYYALAGHPGAATDTLLTYRTDGGRTVRGGGGIEPDSALPGAAEAPLWWSVAADSGFDFAVADSVGSALGSDAASRDAWINDAAGWRERLLEPFLAVVRARLHLAVRTDSAQDAQMAMFLAVRAAEVRWGAEAATELELRNDPDVRAAVSWLERPGVGPSVAPR